MMHEQHEGEQWIKGLWDRVLGYGGQLWHRRPVWLTLHNVQIMTSVISDDQTILLAWHCEICRIWICTTDKPFCFISLR